MEYLKRVFAALMPLKEESRPLLGETHTDVEAYGCGCSNVIVLVADVPELAVHERVSPFSEEHAWTAPPQHTRATHA